MNNLTSGPLEIAWQQAAKDARAMAAMPDLYAACVAADQCITDFLEIYGRGGQMVALDEAVKSLRDDALRLVKIALTKAEVGE